MESISEQINKVNEKIDQHYQEITLLEARQTLYPEYKLSFIDMQIALHIKIRILLLRLRELYSRF